MSWLEEFALIIGILIGLSSLFVAIKSLMLIKKIKKQTEPMEMEVWTNITDLAMIQTAEKIISLKEKIKDVKPQIELWKFEFALGKEFKKKYIKKTRDKMYFDLYQKSYDHLLDKLNNIK
jgi:hypothetical protein